uniref:Opsin n=1 Tax=Exaiptasia diaphana TaxID=2652724 RepID=A0A346FTZ9_EXADI|nr:opsin [Exaiptasia diaphana]
MNTSFELHNSSSYTSNISYKLTEKELMAISIYISIVGGLGIVGNVLVILAFYKYKSLRTSTNTFILHLALCNFILALMDIIFSLPSSIRHKWILGLTACRFYGLIYHFFCSVSLNTLAIISLDRYWVITKPSIGIKITIRRAVLCIVVSYAYTAVFMIPAFLEWESFHEEAFYTGCYINFYDKTIRSLLNAVILGVFLFAVPFAVMIFCYGSIFTSVRRKGRYAVRMRPRCRANKWKFTIQRIPHWRTARMIIVVIFVFLICWSPYVIVSMCMAFGSNITVLTLEITLLLAKSGVIYNPFIYAALNLRFRTAFFEMLQCGRVANRTNWGVKTRVLSGVTGDSSGYLTSRASGCPTSKGLGTSLLRTVERGSSAEAETSKQVNGDQDQYLIEHGIAFKRDEESPNEEKERSNSDDLHGIEYSLVCITHRSSPCNSLLKPTCQQVTRSCGCCAINHETCGIKDIKEAWTENKKVKQLQKVKGNVNKAQGEDSKNKRGSSLIEKRTGSLAEMSLNGVATKEKANQHRRASLHTKQTYSLTCADSEPRWNCKCECHTNGLYTRANIPSIVKLEVKSFKTKMCEKENTCSCAKNIKQEETCIAREKAVVGNTTFIRRTSECVRAHTELSKNIESFWRRPSLVVMNNIRPTTFEEENM